MLTSPLRAYRTSRESPAGHRLHPMAATATERKLFVAGEWVETGDWIDVRSPYSGDVVGRVAKAGADETRRALDAAERGDARAAAGAQARGDPRARSPASSAGATTRSRGRSPTRPGKPMKAARVEASRAMSTYTFAAVEARKLAGEMVPMDAAQAGEGKLALHAPRPARRRRRDLAVQLPAATSSRTSSRPRSRPGCAVVLKPASADAALGAAARRARAGGRAAAGLAQRRRRPGVGDRRRARRGRARRA